MSAILPINMDDLLHGRGVESERVECKASWDPNTTGFQTLRTICAFANDHHNLNGGYIIVGVEESAGRILLPPRGLSEEDVSAAQRWLRGQCRRLDPPYQPILSPERVEGRLVLVVWAPGSDTRPHRAPDATGDVRYWVRLGAETVDAETRGSLLGDLLRQTARVPWDDRRALDAEVEDVSESKVREHLRETRSGLLEERDARVIYRRMRITTRVNAHETPRNVGLALFASEPSRWFRGASIEVVQFASGRAGDVQEERSFGGPLVDQIRNCLNHLEGLSVSHLQKQPDRIQVRGWVSYPLPALRETLVNAVYHRGYDQDQPEPTKVWLYPDRVEVTSYPGPVPGIESHHLTAGAPVPAAPARNRRIGEFLKELRLAEGRLSGLPKVFRSMADNGSPEPRFDFDDQRTWFRATLPAHPEYGALSAVRDAAHLRALGDSWEAARRIESAWQTNQTSAVLATEMIRLHAERADFEAAEAILRTFEAEGAGSAIAHLANALAAALIDAGRPGAARRLLDARRDLLFGPAAIEAAILARRAGDSRSAHRCFERAGDAVFSDPRALLEFAQTKLVLAQEAYRRRQRDSNRRLLIEARALLERVIQLDVPPARRAWAWRELARTLDWLRVPTGEIERAYRKAITLLPDERRFHNELQRFLARRAHRQPRPQSR